jgi:7,8-dihydropterin-6-yl-methyl-4-(beta-D-ribofuranosyl)aminobenzene 5'-phosphate synthase
VDEVLNLGASPVIYAPAVLSSSVLSGYRQHTEIVPVSEKEEIAPGVHTTGLLGNQIQEQALILETEKGSVIITGCAHPGIVAIVRAAKKIVPGEVALLIGGFHLADLSREAVWDITAALQSLDVRRVIPTHCTGEMAIGVFRQAFKENYIEGGAGQVIHMEEME